MSKKIIISVLLFSMVVGIVIGYYRALPDDFVETTEDGLVIEDYGYRCGDGSEFTIVPTDDMKTIDIVPASSVDYVQRSTLTSVDDGTGIHYEGNGFGLRPSASGLVLTSQTHPTTTCSSMRPASESLFN